MHLQHGHRGRCQERHLPVDETCEAYLKGRSRREWKKYEADPDAEYERTITIDLDTLVPTVSLAPPAGEHPPCEEAKTSRSSLRHYRIRSLLYLA